jgi:hypothetical protein
MEPGWKSILCQEPVFWRMGLSSTLCLRLARIATGRIMSTVMPGSSQSNRDRSELVALRRLGTVEDCAKVVEFLATDLSDYVTGPVIPIDGGLVRVSGQRRDLMRMPPEPDFPPQAAKAYSGTMRRHAQQVTLLHGTQAGHSRSPRCLST